MNLRTLPALALALATGALPLSAALQLGSPFTDHMVLQRDRQVPVWGTADTGTRVTVTFAGQTKAAIADAEGTWRLNLDAMPASSDGRTFTVTGAASDTRLEIIDVLVGEVWLASGQSNMAFTVSKARARYAGVINEEQEIAAANYPRIRMFTAASTKTYEPQATVDGSWEICSPETVPGFSALGYMFARDLQQELDIPIGILTVAYGASTAEAWMSREALAGNAHLKFMLDSLDASVRYFRATPQGPAADAPIRPTPINKPRTPVTQLRDPVQDQHFATVLFNGMLHPVIPYAIRGAIWYQGESICWGTPGLNLYGEVMQAMVQDWRAQWGEGDFPFYFVQLPGQENISNNPRIREEQAEVLALPHTGMAVTIDVGEAHDVHPHNKAPVADRLARLALANDYGRKIESQSPMFASMRVDGSSIRVKLDHTAGGLVAKGGPLQGFAIAGADQHFVPATARIDGDTIIVTSPEVAQPVAVRYAWDNYPEGKGCNLVNAAGLPAAPFRTDGWNYPIEGIVED